MKYLSNTHLQNINTNDLNSPNTKTNVQIIKSNGNYIYLFLKESNFFIIFPTFSKLKKIEIKISRRTARSITNHARKILTPVLAPCKRDRYKSNSRYVGKNNEINCVLFKNQAYKLNAMLRVLHPPHNHPTTRPKAPTQPPTDLPCVPVKDRNGDRRHGVRKGGTRQTNRREEQKNRAENTNKGKKPVDRRKNNLYKLEISQREQKLSFTDGECITRDAFCRGRQHLFLKLVRFLSIFI